MYVLLSSPLLSSVSSFIPPQIGLQLISKQASSLPRRGRCAFSVLLLTWSPGPGPGTNVTQANTSSTSLLSSSAAPPTLNDVVSSLKRPPLDVAIDPCRSHSFILFPSSLDR